MSSEKNNDTTVGLLLDVNLGYDDAYGEGFADGRSSMATSVAKVLLDQMTDEAISEITGQTPATIAAMRSSTEANSTTADPSAGSPKEDASGATSSFSLVRENPISGTTLVEPSFVRLVRLVNNITQASLARELGVHERTVCLWETAEMPVRMKTTTYSKLQAIADVKP